MSRELRNDPGLYPQLSKLIPISAVRNRDRQDVESVLQMSAPAVTDVLSENVAKVTHTRKVQPDRRQQERRTEESCCCCHGSSWQFVR